MYFTFPRRLHVFVICAVACGVTACATYYQKHFDFNQEFEQGHLTQALETLKKNEREGEGKTRFLYYVNKGLLLSILGKYEESNTYFEQAFLFGEDYRINYIA